MSVKTRPVIGVTTKLGDPEWVRQNTQPYLDALDEFGAHAVVLAPDAATVLPSGRQFVPDAAGRLPREIMQHLDGLILAGGGDVDPKYFGETLNGANVDSISLLRDELELTLSRDALTDDLPTLGICRGCQVLNVAAGGGMVQHFDGHRSSDKETNFHNVHIVPTSRLYAIIGQETLPTNSYHHQGLDQATLAPLFTSTAICATDEWLIEAFESNSHRWMLAVQWHPERLGELCAAHRKLWVDFVAACREYRRSKSALPTRA